MTSNILVLGGKGKTGRKVVERLTKRQQNVRVGSRSEAIPFDWENRATWAPLDLLWSNPTQSRQIRANPN